MGRIIALWWIWFKSGATKQSSVSVVCVRICLLCECGMFVCICSNFIKGLTHARALPVSIPDIRDGVASYKEVHQALTEKTDKKGDIKHFREKIRYPVPFTRQKGPYNNV